MINGHRRLFVVRPESRGSDCPFAAPGSGSRPPPLILPVQAIVSTVGFISRPIGSQSSAKLKLLFGGGGSLDFVTRRTFLRASAGGKAAQSRNTVTKPYLRFTTGAVLRFFSVSSDSAQAHRSFYTGGGQDCGPKAPLRHLLHTVHLSDPPTRHPLHPHQSVSRCPDGKGAVAALLGSQGGASSSCGSRP